MHVFGSCLAFVYGMVLGSFANVIGYRLAIGEPIFPRSRCARCHHTLAAEELIPVLSWIALRGRCSHCRAGISVQYPVIELTTGLLWMMTFWQAYPIGQMALWMTFWLYLMTAVGTDLTSLTVPNILTIPAAGLFLAASGATGELPWCTAVIGMCIGYATIVGIHLLSGGKMGLGDAKLYLAVGAVLGPLRTIESFILAAIFGSITGIGLRLAGRLQPKQPVPFVPFIAAGVIVAAFYGTHLMDMYARLLYR